MVIAMTAQAMIGTTIGALGRRQNPDGGWGASPGKRSNTEVTCLALLALHAAGDPGLGASVSRALHSLTALQRPGGSWPLSGDLPEGSWTTALATFSLALFEPHLHRAVRGAEWLLRQEGRTPGWVARLLARVQRGNLVVELNPDLKGWPWVDGTFSWVEPTAYALLALKKLRGHLAGPPIEARIREGELMLYNRMCEGGGWNYGNSRVFGARLPPYPDTTALALLALQDYQAAEANRLSLLALQRMVAGVESGLTLSWSIISAAAYGRATDEWIRRLARTYAATGFLGETRSIALALLALSGGHRLFRV